MSPTSRLPFFHPGLLRASLAAACALAPAQLLLHVDARANVPVVISPGEQSEPVMVSDGAGGAILTWQDFRNGAESDIYAQRIGPDGIPLWGAGGVAISTAAAFQTLPRIITDGAGGAILAWTDYRNGNGDIYVQRLSPSGSELWTPGGLPICDDGQPQLGVELIAAGNGSVIAVWEDFRAGPDGDLYAQRVIASGIPSWGLNGVTVCDTIGAQSRPSIATDGASGAFVLWRDQRSSGAGDLYAQRINASGARLWAPQGVLACGAPDGQYDPIAVTDGAGGIIAVWMDERDVGIADVYAQRISSGGLPQWAPNGVLLCDAVSYQLFPVAAADGAGGAVIAWEDSRSDTTVDIYAQRVTADGTLLWTSSGVLMCDATGYESLPAICADGGGGAIVIWQDQRNLGDDVYAQRVNGNGVRMWPVAGLGVSLAADSQLSPVLVSDGNGGALFAWYDGRNGNWDVYAQHAGAWGELGNNVGIGRSRGRSGLQLAAPVPNPARGPVQISFLLPQPGTVELAVFDAAGRRVKTLDEGILPAGPHSRSFGQQDDAGAAFPPGLYFIRLTALGRSAFTRFVSIR